MLYRDKILLTFRRTNDQTILNPLNANQLTSVWPRNRLFFFKGFYKSEADQNSSNCLAIILLLVSTVK